MLSSLLLILQLICASTLAHGSTTRRRAASVFGTEGGYDSGGTEPLCWSSQLVDVNASDLGTNISTVEYLNNELYNGNMPTLKLLQTCYNGTSLVVEPLDLGPDRVFFTEQNYTFRIKLETNLSNINDNINLQGDSTVFLRLIMCDAIREGFCDPFVDLRDVYASVRPVDSDLAASPDQAFEKGDGKWNYKEGDALLGIQTKDTFIVSRWVKWKLKKTKTVDDVYRTAVDITLQLKKGTRRAPYFFIAHVVMNFNIGDVQLERVDVTDAVPDNVLEVRDPPKVKEVSKAMKICLGVASGIFGSIALWMFGFIIYHRNHAAMQLAQGAFLASMTGCCFVAIAFTFTSMPTRDLWCQLRGPMVLCPLTIIGAILVGRMWRVYCTLSGAHALGRGQKEKTCGRLNLGALIIDALTCFAYAPLFFFRKKRQAKVRTVVTAQ